MKFASKELNRSRDNLIFRFSAGKVSSNFQNDYTEIIDQYFRRSIQESKVGHRLFEKKVQFALVAVGGYGRMELCLHSDIDILILFGSKIPSLAKDLTEEIFYPLWDLGFDLGHGTRTIKDCLSLCRNNFDVLTSMMDARFICGDSPLFISFMEDLEIKVVSKKAFAFGKWLEERHVVRIETFGDASYLLEPNLKEGIGGLRDYHHILWLARAFFNLRTPRDLEYTGKISHREYMDLINHLRFICLVRNHLHLLSGRKNDRLGFEFQKKIARRLKFKGQKDFLAVEKFMGRLHASMASIKTLHRSFVLSHIPKEEVRKKSLHFENVSEINFDSAKGVISDPFLLMEVFEKSSMSGRLLSMEARRLVREFLYLVDDTFRKSQTAAQGFLNIMNGENTFETLDQMFETGFLDAFIPEFGQIRDRVQFDAYHIFPVDRHALETVKHIKSLVNHKEVLLLDFFSDLLNPEVLFLAALFHDIGKVGKGHSHKGIAITRNIMRRFGYDMKGTEDILFLVGHHLLLVETATRRDLNEEKTVVQCARTIGDVERLKMLYLLTWADSKATGPKAWNEWIANLVQELFFKVLHILERGELATPGAAQKVEQTKSKVQSLIASRMNRHDLKHLFEVMSPRYLLNTHPKSIVCHLKMLQQKLSPFVLEAKEDKSGGFWEVVILAKDRPKLFSDIAGVMALHNINILSSEIYTWRDGTAVDIFRVTNPLDLILPEEIWEKVRMDLKSTSTEGGSLSYYLGQKAKASIHSNLKIPARPPQVIVDNTSSDFFTLIEVFTDDRVGLLYLITRTLFDLGLDIRIAKVSTKGDQIADVFYVRDLEGQKVDDNKQILEIQKALLNKLQMKSN